MGAVKSVGFKYSDVVGYDFEKLTRDVKYEILKMICLHQVRSACMPWTGPGKNTNQKFKVRELFVFREKAYFR